MCGILGLFSKQGPPPHRPLWSQLVNLLRHRGPQEGGWWSDGPFFLGHRRLSIIALETGSQPMASANGGLVITYNGEIYNFRVLKAELQSKGYTFKTDSDTEVLLQGYIEWGERLPEKLTGMFAFAIADRVRGELFLARDRFGEKPLYYWEGPDYLAFASELRPLAALPDFPREFEPSAVVGFLSQNFVPGQKSMLAGVHRLPPAHWAKFSADERNIQQYWNHKTESTAQSVPSALEEFQERFDRAVSLNLTSDVPVGVLLSGGIDSSLVAESAVRQGSLNRAYFIDFEEQTHSEFEAANAVAQHLGLPLERVVLGPRHMDRFLDLVDHADDPLADASCLPYHLLAELAAQNNRVVLGGDGGDEMFGGYMTYRATLLHQRFVARLPIALRKLLSRLSAHLPTTEGKVTLSYKIWRFLRAAHLQSRQAHYSWNGSWLPEQVPGFLNFANQEGLEDMWSRLPSRSLNITDLQMADLDNYLPNDILSKGDRMSMASSLETRAPFLEHELANWALSLPPHLKIGPGGELKRILRAAIRKTLGGVIADRPKQGFSIPIHAWLRTPEAEPVNRFLSPDQLASVGIFDVAQVRDAVEAHMSGKRSYGFELWGMAVLSAWHHLRIANTPELPSGEGVVERTYPLQVEI